VIHPRSISFKGSIEEIKPMRILKEFDRGAGADQMQNQI
jgi:hypothetical protein